MARGETMTWHISLIEKQYNDFESSNKFKLVVHRVTYTDDIEEIPIIVKHMHELFGSELQDGENFYIKIEYVQKNGMTKLFGDS